MLHLRHLLRGHVTSPKSQIYPRILRNLLSTQQEESLQIAESISNTLTSQTPETPTSTITKSLQLNFSHITPSNPLILQTLNLTQNYPRNALALLHWLKTDSVTDETVSYFIDYFGRNKDFKAVHEVMEFMKGNIGMESFRAYVDRLVRAGRAGHAVALFERAERDYGIARGRDGFLVVVERLCENGYAGLAEKMVKDLAGEFFPNEAVCDMLVKAWCVDGKLDEARRLAGEMYRGGFEIGVDAYNAMLDCVCRLCRAKDAFRMGDEMEKVLLEMDRHGVARNTETFNVMIENLCKIRRTEAAMELFFGMGGYGCYGDARTFVFLTRSLYQAARIGEGDEMVDRMKSAGFGGELNKRVYYGFLKILCGIERIDHALSVFAAMKKDGCEPGIKTYDLLIGKLVAHGRVEKANALFSEAVKNGVPMEPKAYKLDPRFAKKKAKIVKKEKKRRTLPEKMAMKRHRLKQIRLSFVKKPKRTTY